MRGLQHWPRCGNDTSSACVQVAFLCLQHVTSTMFSNFDEAISVKITVNETLSWIINVLAIICLWFQFASFCSHRLHCSYSLPSVPHTLQLSFSATAVLPLFTSNPSQKNTKDKDQLISMVHTVITTQHEPCGEHPHEQRSQGFFIKKCGPETFLTIYRILLFFLTSMLGRNMRIHVLCSSVLDS